MEKSYYKFRFSAFQALGIIMTALGVFVLVRTGANAIKSQRNDEERLYSAYEEEIRNSFADEEYSEYSTIDGAESEFVVSAKKHSYGAIPGMLLGTALIMGAVSLFYLPHGEEFRFHRHRRRRDEDDLSDKEFDYPDDEFDYILDEETRQKLLEEKFRRIYEKHNKV